MQRYFGSTAIDGTMSVAEVALATLRKQFSVMLANEDGTKLGTDPEALHDMRVATRRMRSAMDIFETFLPLEVRSFRGELKWLGRLLGGVRDLDVQLERQHSWANELGVEPELKPWFEWILTGREDFRGRLVSGLGSDRYSRFSEGFGESLLREPSDQLGMPIVAGAPKLVRLRWRHLKKAMGRLKDDSADEVFHQARIDAKRYRYCVEFVAPVYGPAAKDLSVSVAKLQDILGLHQDCTVAKEMIREKLMKGWKKLEPSTCFELGRMACYADSIKLEQRTLVKPAFDVIRQEAWPALKTQMVALASREGTNLV